MALESRERLAALRQSVAVDVAGPGAAVTGADGAAPSSLVTAAELAAETVRRTCEQVGEQAAAMLSLGQAAGEISSSLRQACEVIEPIVQRQASGEDASSRVALLVDGLGSARGDVREATARRRVAHSRLTRGIAMNAKARVVRRGLWTVRRRWRPRRRKAAGAA